MIVVHHLNNSRSQRILWLLEELNVPYEIKKYQRMPNYQAPPSLLEIHPLGKSPVIEDKDESRTTVLAESSAIITYLLQKYSDRSILSEDGALDDLYYMHYAESTLMPLIVVWQRLRRFGNRTPWYFRPIFQYVLGSYRKMYVDLELKKNSDMIEKHLIDHSWFARGSDEPTAADYAMIIGLEGLYLGKAVNSQTHPRIVEYVKKGVKKSREFAFAKEVDTVEK
ncbi:thioredoxin-like protein [Lentinula raphanica]|nr:thioredoxin-like protein [Lentinula raphanica]